MVLTDGVEIIVNTVDTTVDWCKILLTAQASVTKWQEIEAQR